ncbi:MAG TPA: hypothetical protein GXX70_09755, partial [Tepidimicrobium sp.]|nr:hypothetical protein [Tepidimicrobium sp.]
MTKKVGFGSLLALMLLLITFLTACTGGGGGITRGDLRGTIVLSGTETQITTKVDLEILGQKQTTKTGAYEFKGLPAGSHTLKVTADGYQDKSYPVVIVKGESVVQNIELVLDTGSETSLNIKLYEQDTAELIDSSYIIFSINEDPFRSGLGNNFTLNSLTPGSELNLIIRAQGYNDATLEHHIVKEGEQEKTVFLSKQVKPKARLSVNVYDSVTYARLTSDIGGKYGPNNIEADLVDGVLEFVNLPANVGAYVTITSEGYIDYKEQVETPGIDQRKEINVNLVPISSRGSISGTITDQISKNIVTDEVNVSIAGKSVAVSNGQYTITNISTGSHVLKLTSRRYLDYSVEVTIIGGENLTQNVEIKKELENVGYHQVPVFTNHLKKFPMGVDDLKEFDLGDAHGVFHINVTPVTYEQWKSIYDFYLPFVRK